MNDRIDVILITGYLGAGKSTLLKHLLKIHEIALQSPALLINEFGQEGVDGRLFDDAGCPLYEINRGSLFCVCTTADLVQALSEIGGLRPGLVLVEATGVAETRDIESILDQPALAGQFRVRANLCVVDALNFTKVAPFLKAARSQVAAADGLIVNKIDLVGPEELTALARLLTEMNPRAPQMTATGGQIDGAFLGELSHRSVTESLAIAQPEAVYSQSFRWSGTVDRDKFVDTVRQLGGRLLRLKGHVFFDDCPRPEFVEAVCGRVTIKHAVADVSQTAFTAIAFGLPDQQLNRAFATLGHREVELPR